jgi:hypothetical protein
MNKVKAVLMPVIPVVIGSLIAMYIANKTPVRRYVQ